MYLLRNYKYTQLPVFLSFYHLLQKEYYIKNKNPCLWNLESIFNESCQTDKWTSMKSLFINLMNTYSWGTCWGSPGSFPGRRSSCRRRGLCGPSVCGSSRSSPCKSYRAYGGGSWWTSSRHIAHSEPQFYKYVKHLITQAIISQDMKT